mmetsp:Transcript_113566/g.242406  ORF Transcript_113566/g.242406 Transcript_113566/m.242406 type:complete len:483 (-) Transcript_113566:111-1559(-)
MLAVLGLALLRELLAEAPAVLPTVCSSLDEDEVIGVSLLQVSLSQQAATRAEAPTAERTGVLEYQVHPWANKNGDAMHTGISPHKAPLDLSAPAWIFEEPGREGAMFTYSTPVIDNQSNVYISSTSGFIYSLTPSGSIRWSVKPAGTTVPTPALLGTSLFAATDDGNAFKLDLSTGEVQWKTQYMPGSSGDAWSVAAEDGIVVMAGNQKDAEMLGGNEFVVALDAESGSVLWTFKPYALVYNFMPAIIAGTVVFADCDGAAYRLRLSNGSVLWQTLGNRDGTTMTTGGAIVGPNGMVYVTSNLDGSCQGLGVHGAVRAHDLESGIVRWERSFEQQANAGAALVHLDNGSLAVLTGIGSNAGFPKPLPSVDGITRYQGDLVALDGATGATLWAFRPPVWENQATAGSTPTNLCLPDSWSNPAVSQSSGLIYVGWQGGVVYAINATDGSEVSKNDLHSGIQGEPAIAPGMLVVASCNRVAAFKM